MFSSAKKASWAISGDRRLTGFIVGNYLAMLNETAGLIGQPDIVESAQADRVRPPWRRSARARPADSRQSRSFSPDDRDQLFNFVRAFRPAAKRLLTSRRRIGDSGDLLILEKLDQSAVLQCLDEIARHNPLLRKTG